MSSEIHEGEVMFAENQEALDQRIAIVDQYANEVVRLHLLELEVRDLMAQIEQRERLVARQKAKIVNWMGRGIDLS